jgi:hypothetical protein
MVDIEAMFRLRNSAGRFIFHGITLADLPQCVCGTFAARKLYGLR